MPSYLNHASNMVPDQYPPGYHFSQPHSHSHPIAQELYPDNAQQYYGHSYALPQHPPAPIDPYSQQHNEYYAYQEQLQAAHAAQRRDSHMSAYDNHPDSVIDPSLRQEEPSHMIHPGYQTVPEDYGTEYGQGVAHHEHHEHPEQPYRSPSDESQRGYEMQSPEDYSRPQLHRHESEETYPREPTRRQSTQPYAGPPQGHRDTHTHSQGSGSRRSGSPTTSQPRPKREERSILPADMPRGSLSGEKYSRHLAKLHASHSPDSDDEGEGDFDELFPEPIRDPVAEAAADPQMPSPFTFETMVIDYLRALSPKKREKALLNQILYDTVLECLRDPKETGRHTAQFRYWCRKMFVVKKIDGSDMLLHENKPVAVREQIYEVLVHCHRQAAHGGRDKTSNQVRKYYSWIPKDVIARFVRDCPFCRGRRTQSSSSLGPMTDAQVNLLTLQVNEEQRGDGPRRVSLAEARAAAQREGHRPYARGPAGAAPVRAGVVRQVGSSSRTQKQTRVTVKYEALPDTVDFNTVDLPAQGVTNIGQQQHQMPTDYSIPPHAAPGQYAAYEAYYGQAPSHVAQAQQIQQHNQARAQQFQMTNMVQAQALVHLRHQNQAQGQHPVMERRSSVYEEPNSLGLDFGPHETARRWSDAVLPSHSAQQYQPEVEVGVEVRHQYQQDAVDHTQPIPQIISHAPSDGVPALGDDDSLSDVRNLARRIAESHPVSESPEQLAADAEVPGLDAGQYDPTPMSVHDSLPELSLGPAHVNASLGLNNANTSYWHVQASPVRSNPAMSHLIADASAIDPFASPANFRHADYEYQYPAQQLDGEEAYGHQGEQPPSYRETEAKMMEESDEAFTHHLGQGYATHH